MERFGRRWPLIIGGVWQSAWLFAFASVGVTKDTSEKSVGTFLIVAACLFILGFASTWGPGIWILIGETFHMRNVREFHIIAAELLANLLLLTGGRDPVKPLLRQHPTGSGTFVSLPSVLRGCEQITNLCLPFLNSDRLLHAIYCRRHPFRIWSTYTCFCHLLRTFLMSKLQQYIFAGCNLAAAVS